MTPKSSEYSAVLERALHHARTYLERLDDKSVAGTTPEEVLRTRLARPLAEQGVDVEQLIDELVHDVEGGLHGSTGGRFFGWVIGGALPASLAADWLTSTWDQNAGLHACGPAVAIIEEICGNWLKELLGLPSQASFAFVTGTQMAHLTCLAAARHSLLKSCQWDVERQGLSGAPQIRVMSGGARHGSIDRAVRLLGLGTDALIELPLDNYGRVPSEVLANELRRQSERSTIVVLQAGDLNIGAFDSFAELIPIAREYGAWVHIDGAFGLWVAATDRYRDLVANANQADSWTADGHKWLNVPYDCGYAFVADSTAHRSAMSHRAEYLTHADGARDQIDWNPEWSRRARGVATYAALRQLGRQGVSDLIERSCDYARTLVEKIGGLGTAEVVWMPRINQGLVRFLDPRPNSTDTDHDRRTDAVMRAVLTTGEAFFTGTTWRGKRCMRISVVNWRTCDADVDRAIRAVHHVLANQSA